MRVVENWRERWQENSRNGLDNCLGIVEHIPTSTGETLTVLWSTQSGVESLLHFADGSVYEHSINGSDLMPVVKPPVPREFTRHELEERVGEVAFRRLDGSGPHALIGLTSDGAAVLAFECPTIAELLKSFRMAPLGTTTRPEDDHKWGPAGIVE